MGWTGIYKKNVKSASDRKRILLDELNQENKIIDIANKGNTFYIAYKVNENEIYALVILTEYRQNEFLYKVMGEDVMPYQFECPKRILNKLTPTNNEYANKWREKCNEKFKKNNLELSN